MTDVALLHRIVARDTAALVELYDRHNRLLFGLILRIVRDRTEAEDLLQQVFIRIWTRGELYDQRLGSPMAWLVRLARNCAIDRLRARKVRDTANAQTVEEPETNPALSGEESEVPRRSY